MTAFCVEAHDDDKWDCVDAPPVDYIPPWGPFARKRTHRQALLLELGDRVMGDLGMENNEHWNSSRLCAVLRRRVSGYGNKEA